MSMPVAVPRSVAERKPAHGAPCNRCGLCCMATLCPLALHVFGRMSGPCPALVFGQETSCGLVADPAKHSPLRAEVLGADALRAAALVLIGTEPAGCDARINGERQDVAFENEINSWERANWRRLDASWKIWGFNRFGYGIYGERT